MPGISAYGASKAALHHLVLSLTAEESDVISMSILPGVVDTQMQVDVRPCRQDLPSPELRKVVGMVCTNK